MAGSVALNIAIGSSRISRDIDPFHDTIDAVAASWQADRALLEGKGLHVSLQRERDGFVEAVVNGDSESVLLQWTTDSAFRFFPLVEHADFGLALHPFDLATNKVLALVGRLEARDWVDVISCHEGMQRLGYLAWAAAGKDAGFSPPAILEQAGRSARYSREEIATLVFAGPAPDAAALSHQWRGMLEEAHEIIGLLPPERTGACVLDARNELFNGNCDQLRQALAAGRLNFHQGRIRGALPAVRDTH